MFLFVYLLYDPIYFNRTKITYYFKMHCTLYYYLSLISLIVIVAFFDSYSHHF